VALILPVIPGGAGTAIKAARAAGSYADANRALQGSNFATRAAYRTSQGLQTLDLAANGYQTYDAAQRGDGLGMFLGSTHLTLRGLQGIDRLGYEFYFKSRGLHSQIDLGLSSIRIRAKAVAAGAFSKQKKAAEALISRHAVDMNNAPVSSDFTSLGFKRNGPWFWRQLLAAMPEMFSAKNTRAIKAGRSPKVDATWLKFNSQHKKYLNDKLVHHHIDQGRFASGIPETVHHDLYALLHTRTTV